MFEFGDRYRGKYDASVEVVKSYYASVSGYKDELLWGAMWLYKATDSQEYLKYVINKAHCFGGTGWAMTEFSWDVKYAGLQIMVSKVKLLFFVPLLSFSLSFLAFETMSIFLKIKNGIFDLGTALSKIFIGFAFCPQFKME